MNENRVTEEYMNSRIKSTEYFVLPGTTVTVCNITIDNGFSVRGEAACVDPENFDEEIGRRISQKNAYNKLWSLFGFLLAETLYTNEPTEEAA